MSGYGGSTLLHMKETCVEGIFYFTFQCSPFFGFGGEALQACKTMHQLQDFQIIGGSYKRTIRFAGRVVAMNHFQRLGRHAPVTVFVFGDDKFPVQVILADMRYPFL